MGLRINFAFLPFITKLTQTRKERDRDRNGRKGERETGRERWRWSVKEGGGQRYLSLFICWDLI